MQTNNHNPHDTPRQWFSLSGSYFFFFALLGIIVPYWGAYLTELGFNSAQIGELMALLMATRIVMPILWSIRVDRTLQRLEAIRWGAGLSLLFFCGFFFVKSYWSIAIVLMLFASCWSAILPQMEVITLTSLAHRSDDYSKIRVWGSVGFIVLVSLGGVIFEHYGIKWLIGIGSLLLVCLAIISLFLSYHVKPTDQVGNTNEIPFRQLIGNRNIVLFFAAVLLLQVSHGPYYSFFVLYLKGMGYSESFAGIQIALGVVAEVAVFTITATLLRRFGAKQLLLISMLLSALRWILMPVVIDSVWLLSLNQLLHAASFGSAHAGAMAMLNHWFTGASQGRGQAVYASISFGLGGAIGALYAGYTWHQGAGANVTWLIASGTALLAMVLVWLIQYPQQNNQAVSGT